jgi:hypothetical protein
MMLSAPRARAQISPGPLAKAHQSLEGVRNCTRCHGTKKEEMPGRCLDCHRDIAWLTDRSRGFHAGQAGQKCAACHPDHAGPDFALVTWAGGDSSRFDHSLTGWPLAGGHAGVACTSCHRMVFRVSPAAKLSQRTTTPGWTGLEQGCAGCHADPHRGSLGRGCAECHDVRRWSPAPGFDHDSTGYALTGRHRNLACAACHAGLPAASAQAGAAAIPAAFAPLPHADCAACHRDPHGGRLGSVCANCHVTTGFTSVTTGTFDHERTRYPLRGAHQSVRCDQCHDFRTSQGHGPRDRPFATCAGCHADPHAGSATRAGNRVDCASCHEVRGFRPASFSVAAHATTRFALLGRHQTVPCGACHLRDEAPAHRTAVGSAAVQLHPPSGCLGCHQDPHQGRLQAGSDCLGCHDMAGFRPSTVTVASHARYRFPLEGAHRATPCAACHRSLSQPGVKPLLFQVAGSRCQDCHADPHGGQFAGRGGGGCEQCHGVAAFRPATGFDHDRDTQFPLRGGHAGLACSRCHRTEVGSEGRRVVRFRPTPTRCEACHTGGRPEGS